MTEKNEDMREALRDAIQKEVDGLYAEIEKLGEERSQRVMEAIKAGTGKADVTDLADRQNALHQRIMDIFEKTPDLARALDSDQSGTA